MGNAQGVRIYELLALAADATAALDAYLDGRFDEAVAACDRVLDRRPGDRAAARLRARAAGLGALSPAPDQARRGRRHIRGARRQSRPIGPRFENVGPALSSVPLISYVTVSPSQSRSPTAFATKLLPSDSYEYWK